MAEHDINNLVNQIASGGTMTLCPPKGEFEGPVVIRKPLTLIGQQGVIWAKRGPVLRIECSGVVLQDLNVEVTSRSEMLTGEEACAIVVAPGLGITLNDVCVRGNLTGLCEEEGNWRYPRSLVMSVQPNRKQKFQAKFTVPVPCRLVSNIAGVTFEPSNLKVGETEVTIILDPLAPGVRIRGEISLKTAFLIRQIALNANVGASANERENFQVTFWDSLSAGAPTIPAPPTNQEASATKPATTPKSRSSRTKHQKALEPTQCLGPGSVPAQEPIPEKLEPEKEPVAPPQRHVPEVFGKPKTLPPSTATSKIKSVPVTGIWSQPASEQVTNSVSPTSSEKIPKGFMPVNRETNVHPIPPVAPVDITENATCTPTDIDVDATTRKRQVQDFSAFKVAHASSSLLPDVDTQKEKDEDKLKTSIPEENKKDPNKESASSSPETQKTRKLVKTNGKLGVFGNGTELAGGTTEKEVVP